MLQFILCARFLYLYKSYLSENVKRFYRILILFKFFYNIESKSLEGFDVTLLALTDSEVVFLRSGLSRTKALDGFIWSESIECNLSVSNATRVFFL